MRVVVEELTEGSAICPWVLVGWVTADEDGGGAVLVILAGLATGGSILVSALIFDGAGAGAVVGDAVEGSAAVALAGDAVCADEVGWRAFRGLGHGRGGCAGGLEDGRGTVDGYGGPRRARGDIDDFSRSSCDGRVCSDGRVVFRDRVSPALGAGIDSHSLCHRGARGQGAERRRRV